MASTNGSISRKIRKFLCKALVLCLALPGCALATNVEDSLTVGIFVKCGGAGNGAWGKIDDAMLNSDS